MRSREVALLVGWATEDITPDESVNLYGQYYERMSRFVESPLTVTAWAIESVSETPGAGTEQAILISMDILWCTTAIQEAVRNNLRDSLPDFDSSRLILSATHTHSAPEPASEGVFGSRLVTKLTAAAMNAWKSRSACGGVGNVLGYAVVGHNRRIQYADGSAEMYGATSREDFLCVEGPTDSSVDMVFCWNQENKLSGIIINVPCPAQVTEAKYYISADFWSEVRTRLKDHFSSELFILAQCGASGDLSPRDLTRGYKGGEPDMWDVPGMAEIGKRLSNTVIEAYHTAEKNKNAKLAFKHVVEVIDIPLRTVTEQEHNESLAIVKEIQSREPADPSSPLTAWNRFLDEIRVNERIKKYGPWDNKNTDYGIIRKKELAVQQYYSHPEKRYYKAEVHVIRLGSLAIATNPFELFVDYGFAIKGRSMAEQTMITQLCCDYADYLPTKRAMQGGGYSAMATAVGDDGGEVLVKKTIGMINDLFE